MKRLNEAVGWGLFLLLAGVFLLLRNLDVFGPWGSLAWAILYAVAGLAFLIWFIVGIKHWWRAIPAFTLLGIGAGLILASREVELGEWNISLVLFGMALGFWTILLVDKEHWWALLPAGVLTTVAVLLGLWDRLDETGRLAVLFLGIGLMFLLLYLIRYSLRDTRWAAIPAGALLLLGVVTLIQALQLPALLTEWWPILLVVAGLVLAISGFATRQAPELTPALPLESLDAVPPAPGSSVTTELPPGELSRPKPQSTPAPPLAPAPSTGQDDADIYEIIKQQPQDPQPPPSEKP